MQPRQQLSYPKAQKPNLLEDLRHELLKAYDEGEQYYSAFRAVSLEWLGYTKDNQPIVVDGNRDRGFDAYRISDKVIEIFQFKSQDYTRKSKFDVPADPATISDISRSLSFLKAEDHSAEIKNRKIKKFISVLQTAMTAESISESETFTIRINLICLYDDLTPEAKAELSLIRTQNEVITVMGREVWVEINFAGVERRPVSARE
jgi:hypothetical protein